MVGSWWEGCGLKTYCTYYTRGHLFSCRHSSPSSCADELKVAGLVLALRLHSLKLGMTFLHVTCTRLIPNRARNSHCHFLVIHHRLFTAVSFPIHGIHKDIIKMLALVGMVANGNDLHESIFHKIQSKTGSLISSRANFNSNSGKFNNTRQSLASPEVVYHHW